MKIIEEYIKRNIHKNELAEILVCLLLGLFLYMPMNIRGLTGPDGIISNVDHLWYWDTSLGRWMIMADGYARNMLTLPNYIIITTLIIIALTGVILLRIFRIKSIFAGIILGAILVTFPCTANSMQLFYYDHLYFGSTLLAAFAVYFTSKKNWIGTIFGTLLLCIGLGSYQSCIGIAISLCLIEILLCALEKSKIKNIINMSIRFVIMGGGGILLYFISTKIILGKLGIALADYSGISEMDNIAFLKNGLLNRVIKTYKTTFEFYFTNGLNDNYSWGFTNLYVVIGLVLIVLLLYYLSHLNFKHMIICCVCIILLPIGLDAIEIAAPERELNNVLCQTMLYPIILCIYLLENLPKRKIHLHIIQFIAIISMVLLINSYYMYDDAIIMAMELTQNKTISLANRILYKMEETDGYEPGMKILICGTENPDNYPLIYNNLYDKVSGSVATYGMMWSGLSTCQTGWINIFKNYCGIEFIQSVDEDFNIIKTDDYKDMNAFPYSNSVKVINDIMVVKLSYNY